MTNYLDKIIQSQPQVSQTQIPANQIKKTPESNQKESKKFDEKTLAIAGTALGAVVAAGVLIYKGRGKQALKVFKEGLNGKTLEELKGIVPKNKHQQELLNTAINSAEKTAREAAQKAEKEVAEAAARHSQEIAGKAAKELDEFTQNIQGKPLQELEQVSTEGLPSEQIKVLEELKAVARHSQKVAETAAKELDEFTQSLQGKSVAELDKIATDGLDANKINAIHSAKSVAQEAEAVAKKATKELDEFAKSLQGRTAIDLENISTEGLSADKIQLLTQAKVQAQKNIVEAEEFIKSIKGKSLQELRSIQAPNNEAKKFLEGIIEGKEVDEIFADPKKVAEIDGIMQEHKLLFQKVNKEGEVIEMLHYTPNEILQMSIKDSDIKGGSTLYHGTSQKAGESIKQNGFNLDFFKKGESGKGVYLATNDSGAAQYVVNGGTMINARLKDGLRIARIEAPKDIYNLSGNAYGLVSGIAEDGNLRTKIAKALGLPVTSFLPESISKEYINRRLASLGYAGLDCTTYGANCRYIMIPDPKNIEILK